MSLVFYKKVIIQNQNLYPAVTKMSLIEFEKAKYSFVCFKYITKVLRSPEPNDTNTLVLWSPIEPSQLCKCCVSFKAKHVGDKDAAMQLTNTIFNNDYVKQQCCDSHIKQPAFV